MEACIEKGQNILMECPSYPGTLGIVSGIFYLKNKVYLLIMFSNLIFSYWEEQKLVVFLNQCILTHKEHQDMQKYMFL